MLHPVLSHMYNIWGTIRSLDASPTTPPFISLLRPTLTDGCVDADPLMENSRYKSVLFFCVDREHARIFGTRSLRKGFEKQEGGGGVFERRKIIQGMPLSFSE